MSQQAVHQIIGRAVTDAANRELLFSDWEQAVGQYDLTGDERRMLGALNQADLADFAGRLDERITKGKWIDG